MQKTAVGDVVGTWQLRARRVRFRASGDDEEGRERKCWLQRQGMRLQGTFMRGMEVEGLEPTVLFDEGIFARVPVRYVALLLLLFL